MPEWRELREAAMRRADGRCEYCGEPAVHVHHVSYPKFRGEEHPDTLVAICADCHDLSHGKKPMNYPAVAAQPIRITAFSGTVISVVPHNKHLYMTDGALMEGLGTPKLIRGYFGQRIAQSALLLSGQSDEPIAIVVGGIIHYRLHVGLVALENYYHEVLKNERRTTGSRAELEAMNECRDKYRAWQGWLHDLAAQAIESKVAQRVGMTAPPNQPVADISPSAWLMSIREAVSMIAPKVAEHDQRIARVEAVVHRDPTEYVTVRAACMELAVLPEQIVYGRQNLETRVGMLLANEGADCGPEQMTRLSGNSLAVPIKTWKRGDAYRVIGQAVGGQYDQRLLPLAK